MSAQDLGDAVEHIVDNFRRLGWLEPIIDLMNLGQLSAGEIARRLAGPGLGIRTGPFNLRIRSDAPSVLAGIRTLYEDYPVIDRPDFCDYSVAVERPRGVRRWIRPQVQFTYDHQLMYEPMPLGHAMPLVEWALNWCIGSNSHQYLALHAAAIERDGYAAILPAPPGSGKSTLVRRARLPRLAAAVR